MSAGFGCFCQFDGFFRKPIEDFPLSSIFNTAGYVHRHQWYLGLLDWIVCSCPGRYSPLQSPLNVWGWICPPVYGSFPRLHYTVNNVHITVRMIMEWHVSISSTPFKLLNQTHRPWGPTLEILQKPWQECLDVLSTSFIEGAPYRKEDSIWHNGRW